MKRNRKLGKEIKENLFDSRIRNHNAIEFFLAVGLKDYYKKNGIFEELDVNHSRISNIVYYHLNS